MTLICVMCERNTAHEKQALVDFYPFRYFSKTLPLPAGGVEKRGPLLCSLALVGHERGDSLLKNEIALGMYLWGKKSGKNRRAPEEKVADPMNKAMSNRHA
jgi:hypothetical protein